MNLLEDFLLQLTFLILPIFIYFTFIIGVDDNKNRRNIMTVFWGLSILACILFPVTVDQASRLDLRSIPLIFGSLYGGLWPALLLSAIVIILRFLVVEPVGFYNTVLVLLLTMPVILYVQKTFINSKKEKKIKITTGIALYYCICGISVYGILRGFSFEQLKFQIIHLLFVVTITCLFTILNEKIREIHFMRTEMQNSERMRVISELTSVFAHEIRNPMQTTRGFLQLLNDPDLSEKKREYIQISLDELDRANEIISDFLSFGKPSSDHDEKMNVSIQLKRVVNILQSYALNHHVDILTDFDDTCWIYANPQKFNQSLINIIKNAIESMPNGGTVQMACSSTKDGYVQIKIKDEGIGMTKKQVDRLGSPFYSLKEKGTGLGMMVSTQIIRSFKGKINVTSEQGKGTEFIILLPQGKEQQ